MTVKQFIRKVARDNGLYVYQVEQCLYAIFDGINEVLESGDDINFIRFGHFLTADMEGHKCVLKGEEIMTKPYTKIIYWRLYDVYGMDAEKNPFCRYAPHPGSGVCEQFRRCGSDRVSGGSLRPV